VIDGPEMADAVANEIMQTPVRRGSRTSISGAILYAMPLFDENLNRGFRRVIDISGDGPNNNGPPVTPARDEALAKGIVINGLPVMVKEPSYSSTDIEHLDCYYEDCVIGGAGLLRRDDQGPRQLQGGHPDEASARGRWKDARTSRGADR
jgi:hypothetical protein